MIPMARHRSQLKKSILNQLFIPFFQTIPGAGAGVGGLQITLQMSVSSSSIILSFAHFSPLFFASSMFTLRIKIKNNKNFKRWRYEIVLTWSYFCFPIRMWQSKMSKLPMAQHHSQLKTSNSKPSFHPFSFITIPGAGAGVGGLQITLHMSVSSSSIILSFAHFSPLFFASSMFALRIKDKEQQNFKCWRCDIVLSLS